MFVNNFSLRFRLIKLVKLFSSPKNITSTWKQKEHRYYIMMGWVQFGANNID